MSDGREMVRQLLEGGREAWDRFAREYRLVVLKAVHAAARRVDARDGDVEDAASEVFVELLKDDAKALRAYKGEAALSTFLTVIAYRVALREFTRRTPAPDPPRPAAPADREILVELEKLPERDRRAIVLYHIEGHSYREIALKLGIPQNQVGMVLSRAREALARILRR